MSTSILTPDQKQLAALALDHQNSGRYPEAAQAYAALLSAVPHMWPACYNLGLVYQHLERLPEAAEMYARVVRLNPQFGEAYNNLGNVLKALKKDDIAMEAYQQAIAINPQLSEAAYNLATMLQSQGKHLEAIESLQKALAGNPTDANAWDALYRSFLATGRQEEAIQAFLEWERSAPPSPELVVAGLALCRPMGDLQREKKYLELAVNWPFTGFKPDQYAPIVGMIQYFDVSREQILACYQRFDQVVIAQNPAIMPLLPTRSAGKKLRIGYLSGDFRQHVMGRLMLDVVKRHDLSQFSVLLISTCPRARHDALTDEFRRNADGFADISELDDFAAAKIVAEADIDVLVDLGGQTNSSRPGLYAHRPARSIVTHLGSHGCIGMRAIDYKFTDAIADLPDASAFQIEKPYVLDTCVFPFQRTPASPLSTGWISDIDLTGKFVFAAFLNILKLSPRCLALWSNVLTAVPNALLLFSPLDSAEQVAIRRIASSAGIDPARVAILTHTNKLHSDSELRARYHLVHAVLDTFPYCGGDTSLAALDMGIPVVTLAGQRQSERIGASILTHLGLEELVAHDENAFVAKAVRLAGDAAYLASCREKITLGFDRAVSQADHYTRALEKAYVNIAAQRGNIEEMTLTSREFFQSLHDAMRRQERAVTEAEKRAVAEVFATLRIEQPAYPPLLRAQAQLAQELKNLPLASDCLSALLKASPEDLDARLTLAGFLIDQGNAKDALQVLEDASASGNKLRTLKLQARAYSHLRQWNAARQYSELAVSMAPGDPQALFWHGTVLSHTGETTAALGFLNRALILSPENGEAAYTAGVLLDESGNHADAEKVFRRAMASADMPQAHLHLLQSLKRQRRRADWLSEAQKFIDAYPGLEYSQWLESRIARRQGLLKREAELLLPLAEQAANLEDHLTAFDIIAEILAILPCHDVSPRLLEKLRARFSTASAALHPSMEIARAAPREDEPVRLGCLVDSSLPFAFDIVASIAAHLDRSRFTLFVFELSPPTQRSIEAFDAIGVARISLAAFDADRCAELIRSQLIDVILDASAFGDFAKPGIFSLRPAPLQIALPALTTSTAIGELDYHLADRSLYLNGDSGDSTMRPLLVQGCALPIVPDKIEAPSATNDPSSIRSALGIPSSAVVFGIFASAEQISPRALSQWRTLLDRVPAAVLLLSPFAGEDVTSMRAILTAGGFDSARIFATSQSLPAIPALSEAIDVILDTFPASDYTSARAALLSSIPIVTTAGRTPGERTALTLLTHLGETSTIAESGRQYVDMAADLAADAAKRRDISSSMKSQWQRLSQPGMPFSAQGYVKDIENVIAASYAAALKEKTQ